jgi:uncharacterized membrane protein YkvA (DUF1232 family)
MASLGSSVLRPWLLRGLAADLRVALRLLREPRVSGLVKALPLLGLLYILSPVDVVPDVFPFAGQLDDVTVAFLALKAFLKLCPRTVAAHHRDAERRGEPYAPMRDSDLVIEANYRRE